jgi:chaperonin GroES
MNQMKIRPLHDRLIVRRDLAKDQTEGGIYIPDNAKEVPIQGEVLAVGTGRVAEDGTVRPLGVKVGEVALFSKYAGTEIPSLGENFIILREEDILGIVEAG